MFVKVLVTIEIEALDDRFAPDEKLAASAREAIDNALALGADTGFDHELAENTTVHVASVELPEDAWPANRTA